MPSRQLWGVRVGDLVESEVRRSIGLVIGSDIDRVLIMWSDETRWYGRKHRVHIRVLVGHDET